jgi:hypothetical protein
LGAPLSRYSNRHDRASDGRRNRRRRATLEPCRLLLAGPPRATQAARPERLVPPWAETDLQPCPLPVVIGW